jgi:hypothetical protein
MNSLRPDIHITSDRVTFQFFLNEAALPPIQALDMFEYANGKTEALWAYRLVNFGLGAEIYRTPQTFRVELTPETIAYGIPDPARIFEWLPDCVAQNFMSRAHEIMVRGDSKEFLLNAFINRTVRV